MRNAPKWTRRLPKFLLLKHASTVQNIYHCCIHKTASQWIRAIMDDYRIYRYCGLQMYNYEDNLPGGADERPLHQRTFDQPFPDRTIVTPIFVGLPGFQTVPKPDNFRAFFVMRDPRDYLVSMYYSMMVSHKANVIIVQARENLQHLTKEEGLKMIIERMVTKGQAAALRSWQHDRGGDERLRLFRYEDLTGDDQFAAWEQLVRHCDIRIPAAQLRAVLSDNAFSKMTKGRERGTEDVNAHLRKGVPGDWKNHFTPAVEKKFREATGTLVEELGYSW
jgi:hypothetical protein